MTIDNEFIQKLSTIAREAGKFMLGSADRESTEKSGATDFVTVADIKSQGILTERLNHEFPGVPVLSEEHSEAERQKLYDPAFTGFVLDPIDGTYNFKRDMRESAISVGYIENGQIQAGVVFDPYKDEMFVATLGGGATRNGQPIRVSGQTELRGSSVATSNGYDDAAAARNFQRQVAIFEQTGIMPWSSCPGSAVLALVWIACGRIDAIHHTGFKPWDNAAAFLIVREAGGEVLTLTGKEAAFIDAKILAGTPALVDQLQGIFSKIDAGLLS